MNARYAIFIWSSYGLAFCVLAWNLLIPLLQRRQLRRRSVEFNETDHMGEGS